MKNIKNFLNQLFQDKNGNYAMRECIVCLFVAVILVSWIAQQFFHRDIPMPMFYSFVSLVGAGCFGYSLEKRFALPSDTTPPTA